MSKIGRFRGYRSFEYYIRGPLSNALGLRGEYLARGLVLHACHILLYTYFCVLCGGPRGCAARGNEICDAQTASARFCLALESGLLGWLRSSEDVGMIRDDRT